MEQEKMLTTTEVAEMFGVSSMAVRRWINSGKLKALTIPGQRKVIRIPLSEVEALQQKSREAS